MSRNVKIAIGCGVATALLLCILCVALIAAIVFGAFKLTESIADAGDDFMRALRDEDYEQAFDLCSPSYQKQLGSARQMRAGVLELELTPKSWTWNNRNVGIAQDGTLEGWVTFESGDKEWITLSLTKVDGEWRITDFDGLD